MLCTMLLMSFGFVKEIREVCSIVVEIEMGKKGYYYSSLFLILKKLDSLKWNCIKISLAGTLYTVYILIRR